MKEKLDLLESPKSPKAHKSGSQGSRSQIIKACNEGNFCSHERLRLSGTPFFDGFGPMPARIESLEILGLLYNGIHNVENVLVCTELQNDAAIWMHKVEDASVRIVSVCLALFPNIGTVRQCCVCHLQPTRSHVSIQNSVRYIMSSDAKSAQQVWSGKSVLHPLEVHFA